MIVSTQLWNKVHNYQAGLPFNNFLVHRWMNEFLYSPPKRFWPSKPEKSHNTRYNQLKHGYALRRCRHFPQVWMSPLVPRSIFLESGWERGVMSSHICFWILIYPYMFCQCFPDISLTYCDLSYCCFN